MDKIIKFLESFLPRRIMFYIVNKIFALYLIWHYFVIDQMYALGVFAVSSIYDLVILNEINFEKVKTEISLRGGNGRSIPQ